MGTAGRLCRGASPGQQSGGHCPPEMRRPKVLRLAACLPLVTLPLWSANIPDANTQSSSLAC